MNNTWKIIKKIFSWILGILVICLIVAPWVIIFFYMRRNGKKIIIYPEFEIIDISEDKDIDSDILESSIQAGEEILKRCKAINREKK